MTIMIEIILQTNINFLSLFLKNRFSYKTPGMFFCYKKKKINDLYYIFTTNRYLVTNQNVNLIICIYDFLLYI